MIYGHFTLYFKTVIYHEENLLLVEDVVCLGYVGGNGVQAWDPLNDTDVQNYAEGKIEKDIFVTYSAMSQASHARGLTTWRSITGVMPASLSASFEVNELMRYPGAVKFGEFWGFHSDARDYGQTAFQVGSDVSARRSNVICMQAAQRKYQPHTKTWSLHIRSSEHWGDKVYAGVGKVRDGTELRLEMPKTSEISSISLN